MGKRVDRYCASLKAFLKKKSPVNKLDEGLHKKIILELVDSSNLLFPVFTLTILNSSMRKNKISRNSLAYYTATTVELFRLFSDFCIREDKYVRKYGIRLFTELVGILFSLCLDSFLQNMKVMKKRLSTEAVGKIYEKSLSLMILKISKLLIGKDIKLFPRMRTDVHKYYLYNKSPTYLECLKRARQITSKSASESFDKETTSVGEFIVCSGLVLNQCDIDEYVKRMGRAFVAMCRLADDFDNLLSDIEGLQKENISYNYVLNSGLQRSYNKFMSSKITFTDCALRLGLYTSTIREIVGVINRRVDKIIMSTKPDLRSQSTV